MKIFIASDHAGYKLKEKVISKLKSSYLLEDQGPHNSSRVDYPDSADKVCKKVLKETESVGILICGSGQGMSMRANKYKNIRAALCWSEESVKLARLHNDANVLCIGARLLEEDLIFKIIDLFLNTKFEGGRHLKRTQKLSKPSS